MQYLSREKRKNYSPSGKVKDDVIDDDKKFISKMTSLNAQNLQAGSSEITQVFSFRIQDIVSQQDPFLCWSYNVPILKQNEKALYFASESFQTILPNYVGDDFPQTIYFGLRDFNGYSKKDGSPSKFIMVMDLIATTIKTVGGITMRDLAYKCQNQVLWSLGQLRQLRLQVYVDESGPPVPMPLSIPIQISFKIIHIVM